MDGKKGKRRSEQQEDIEMKADVKKSKQNECVLPFEIITYEILPWVLVKALLRFKLVCKEWCRAISKDSFFKTIQYQRCASLSPVGLIYHGHNNYVLLPTTMHKELVGLPNLSLNKYKVMCDKTHTPGHVFHSCEQSLMASSNGLLCGSYFRAGIEYYYVSNPLTQEMVSIPNTKKLRDFTFAFEPSTDDPYYVLVGRKVITIYYGKCTTDVGFTVFSSKSGVWKVADAKARIFRPCFGRDWPRNDSRSVYTGGKLYWKLANDVLWFDIKEDSAGVVAYPDEKRPYLEGEIGDCHGELSYTEISDSADIIIWGLRSNQKNRFKWVKKYCFSLKKILEDQTKVTCCYNIMMLLSRKLSISCDNRRPLPYEGGDAVMFWVKKKMGAAKGIVLSYNMKTRSLQLNYESELKLYVGPLISYKPSLVSLPKHAE